MFTYPLIPYPAVGVGAGFTLFSLHGSLLPEGEVGFAGFPPLAGGNFFSVSLLLFCQLAGFCLFVLGVFQAFAYAGRVVVASGGDSPGTGAT